MREAGIDAAARDRILTALLARAQPADLPEPDQVMLDYALLVTRRPWEVTATHVEELRNAGFTDRAIHDICTIAAYYAFVNRIASGLGVEEE